MRETIRQASVPGGPSTVATRGGCVSHILLSGKQAVAWGARKASAAVGERRLGPPWAGALELGGEGPVKEPRDL